MSSAPRSPDKSLPGLESLRYLVFGDDVNFLGGDGGGGREGGRLLLCDIEGFTAGGGGCEGRGGGALVGAAALLTISYTGDQLLGARTRTDLGLFGQNFGDGLWIGRTTHARDVPLSIDVLLLYEGPDPLLVSRFGYWEVLLTPARHPLFLRLGVPALLDRCNFFLGPVAE